MAVKNYREMYIKLILSLQKNNEKQINKVDREYLAGLSLKQLKELSQKLNG